MTKPNPLDLARQGDPQAIATLMNHSLQPKGITAKVDLQGSLLRVVLESAQIPNPQVMTTFVRNGLKNLGLKTIRNVEVVGQPMGAAVPAWSEEFEMQAPGQPAPGHVMPPPPPPGRPEQQDTAPMSASQPAAPPKSEAGSGDEASAERGGLPPVDDSSLGSPTVSQREEMPPAPRNLNDAVQIPKTQLQADEEAWQPAPEPISPSPAAGQQAQSPSLIDRLDDDAFYLELLREIQDPNEAIAAPPDRPSSEPDQRFEPLPPPVETNPVQPPGVVAPQPGSEYPDLPPPENLQTSQEPLSSMDQAVPLPSPDMPPGGWPGDVPEGASDRPLTEAEFEEIYPPVGEIYPPVEDDYPPIEDNYPPPVEEIPPPIEDNYPPIQETYPPVEDSYPPGQEPPASGDGGPLPPISNIEEPQFIDEVPPTQVRHRPRTKLWLGLVLLIVVGWIGALAGYALWQALRQPDVAPVLDPTAPPTVPTPDPLETDPDPAAATPEALLQEANVAATRAVTLTETAQSGDDWNLIVSQWQQAIQSLEAVPEGTEFYAAAQARLPEYRSSLAAAQQQAANQPAVTEAPPPRSTVAVSGELTCRPAESTPESPAVELTSLQFVTAEAEAEAAQSQIAGCVTNHTDQPITTVAITYVGGSAENPTLFDGGFNNLGISTLEPGQAIPFRSSFSVAENVTRVTIESIYWTAQGATEPEEIETSVVLDR